MTYCNKGCVRSIARRPGGRMAFLETASGFPLNAQATKLVVPPEVAEDFATMVSLTHLAKHPPTLEMYDDLRGVGGMFVPDAWAIFVGEKDQREIAAEVIRRWPKHVTQLITQYLGRAPTRAELEQLVFDAAVRRCIAHEIGHALIHSGYSHPFGSDDEAGADFFAGQLDAATGRSRALGALFFFHIGCIGNSCTHPSPDQRAKAYAAGYDQQRAA